MVKVAQIDSNNPVLGMLDDLGIVYLVGSAQQFWSGGCFFRVREGNRTDDVAILPLQSSRMSCGFPKMRHRPSRCSMRRSAASWHYVRPTMVGVTLVFGTCELIPRLRRAIPAKPTAAGPRLQPAPRI